MIKEENVNVETQTGEVATATEGQNLAPQNKAPTVLGKFKDVDALARAYESLQAEFTRRSQRLKAMEKEVENFKTLGGESGAEKLRKTAKARREAAKEFDAFVAEVDGLSAEEKPNELETLKGGNEDVSTPLEAPSVEMNEISPSTPIEKAEEEISETLRKEKPSLDGENKRIAEEGEENLTAKEGEKEISSEALFQRAIKDEGVRLRIVGEYLASLGKTGAPLTGSKAGVLATPQRKAKTVGQAGNMAYSYFKKPTLD